MMMMMMLAACQYLLPRSVSIEGSNKERHHRDKGIIDPNLMSKWFFTRVALADLYLINNNRQRMALRLARKKRRTQVQVWSLLCVPLLL